MVNLSLSHLVFALAGLGLTLTLLPGCDRFSPDTAAEHMAKGQEKVREGDLTGALTEFDEAIRLEPGNAESFVHRGNVRRDLGQLDAALADLDTAVGLAPKSPMPYLFRGIIKRRNEDIPAALADIDQALAINPRYSRAYAARGFIKAGQGDKAAAIADFDLAIKHDPNDPVPYEYRASARELPAGLQDAIADLNEAIRLRPDSGSAYASRAVLRGDKGDVIGAIADYDRAIVRGDNNPSNLRGRAIQRMRLREWEKASGDLVDYIARVKKKAEYEHLFLWICRSRLGETDKADQELAVRFPPGAPPPAEAAAAWTANLPSFLLGRLSETALLAAAASPNPKLGSEQQCEAWYYIGIKRSLSPSPDTASEAFRNCLATGVTTFVEHTLAGSELDPPADAAQ